MLTALLQDAFRRFGASGKFPEPGETSEQSELLGRAVEHVIDETYSRLRVVSHYDERLRPAVRQAFAYIGGLVESIPEPVLCSRSRYVSDPRVNAFFVSPEHIQQVFSHSEAVRRLFDSNLEGDECWALLCMRKEERQQLGMALVGDDVRREVLQTRVSFTDHQVMSPGLDESDARYALKCCVFDSLLTYIRRRVKYDKEHSADLQNQRNVLVNQLRRTEDDVPVRQELEGRIGEVERELAASDQPLSTLEDYLAFVVRVLADPKQYIGTSPQEFRLTRTGVKLDEKSLETGYTVPVVEIRVTCNEPRVATLVRFPRAEMLPQPDYLQQADLFLAV